MSDNVTYQWIDIKDAFDDTILLGNGASIAISDQFKYVSLLNKADEDGMLGIEIRRLFDAFETLDFEYVLRMLMIANKVNELVGNQDPITKNLYERVRGVLIQVVQAIHPSHEEVAPYFSHIAQFLSGFRTVFSLNYDLIVYWATMTSNSHPFNVPAYFKDCMWFDANEGYNGELAEFWREFRHRHPRHPQKKPVLVFYPHGSLALVTPIFGRDRKVGREQTILSPDLLQTIVAQWERGDLSPLFVSEGDAEQKKWAIQRSDYLRTVNEEAMIEQVGDNLVMYGFGMKDNDDHITNTLLRGEVERLAFALHRNSEETKERVLRKVHHIAADVGKDVDVVFFSSEDVGAWIYPTT